MRRKKKAASEILMKDPAKRGQSKIGKNPLFESARGSLARPRRRTIDGEREEMPKNRRRFESGEPNKTRFGGKKKFNTSRVAFRFNRRGPPEQERTNRNITQNVNDLNYSEILLVAPN